MILTDAEKKRFSEYLEIEAQSSEILVQQMERMKAPLMLIEQDKELAKACRVLLKRLNSGESMSVRR